MSKINQICDKWISRRMSQCSTTVVELPGGLKHMAKTRLKLVSPRTVKRTVPPTRRPNRELRPREHLTEREVEKLIQAAKGNRWGQRDSTMLLMAFRHGLRASELCGLQWSDVEFASGTLHPAAGPRAGKPARTHCWAMKCGHCGR
jgi:integrase